MEFKLFETSLKINLFFIMRILFFFFFLVVDGHVFWKREILNDTWKQPTFNRFLDKHFLKLRCQMFLASLSFFSSSSKRALNDSFFFFYFAQLQETYSNLFFSPFFCLFCLQSFLRAQHWCTYPLLSLFFLHYVSCHINAWLQLQVLLDRHQVKNLEASVFQWKEWFLYLLIIFTVCDTNDLHSVFTHVYYIFFFISKWFYFEITTLWTCVYCIHIWFFQIN